MTTIHGKSRVLPLLTIGLFFLAGTLSTASAQTRSRAYEAAPVGIPHVSDFGAVGDGVTDDTAALQSALNSVYGGGQLALGPNKTYLLAGYIWGADFDGVTLWCQDSCIKVSDNHTYVTYQPVSFTNATNVYIHDLIIDGNRDNNICAEGWLYHNLAFFNVQEFGLYRVRSNNAACDGLYFDTPDENYNTDTFCKNGKIIDCTANNCFRNGMSIIYGWNIQIIGGEYSNTNGTLPKSGIDVEPEHDGASPGCDNILIRHVKIVNNDGHGVKMDRFCGNRRATIEYCYFSNNARSAIYTGSDDNIIRHNVFYGFDRWTDEAEQPTQGTIRIDGSEADNASITDNLFANIHYPTSNHGFPMIYIAYESTPIEISGNEFYDFRYYRPMSVSGGEPPANFNEINTVDQDKVIADPGLPSMPGTTTKEPETTTQCKFASGSSMLLLSGIVLLSMRRRPSFRKTASV